MKPHITAITRSLEIQSKFERAHKINDWDGWLYLDHLEKGNEEGYFPNLEALIESHLDWINNEVLEQDKLPDFAWTCKKVGMYQIDVKGILEWSTNWFDFNCDAMEVASQESMKKLEQALKEFYEANTHIAAYEPNYRLALLLDWKSIIEARRR